jgi:predicted nucleotidyltransferase
MTTLDAVRQHRPEILELARKHGAANVRIFGSVLRGDDDLQSDIDLLVDAPGPTSAWFPAGLILDLEALLVRKIDVITERGLNPFIRDEVLREAQPV